MTTLYLFGGVLVLLIFVVILSTSRAGRGVVGEATASEERDAAVEALRDLEFEYQTGKISEEDYRAVRERLSLSAVDARRRAAGARAEDAGQAAGGAARACESCGTAVEPDDRFCGMCGEPVASSA